MSMTLTNTQPRESIVAWLLRVQGALEEQTGYLWTVDFEPDMSYYKLAQLDGPAGMKLGLFRTRDGRVQVHGLPPSFDDESGTLRPRHVPMVKAITVGFGRDPAAVAKDIARRVLPAYRDYLAAVEVAIGEARDELAAKRSTMTRLMGAGGWGADANVLSKTCIEGTLSIGVKTGPGTYDSLYGDVKLRHGDGVDIELRGCPPDLAVQVVELLASYAEWER